MSKKGNKKSDKDHTLEKIVLITATLNLIETLIEVIKSIK